MEYQKLELYVKKLVFIIWVIYTISILFSFSASFAMYRRINTKDEYTGFIKHISFTLLSIIIIATLYKHRCFNVIKHTHLLTGVFLFLTILTLITGKETKGATRWLSIGSFSLQPSEFLKVFFTISNAKLLTQRKTILPSVFLLIACITPIILQPDFGFSLIFMSIFAIQIVLMNKNIKKTIFAMMLLISIIATSAISLPHVGHRIKTFAHRNTNLAYQTKKSFLSFKQGKYLGTGIGNGNVKYSLPDAESDYIFSLIAEEGGILMCIIVILMYYNFLITILKMSDMQNNKLHQNIALSVATSFLPNIIINISCNLGIIPVKGAAMPFMSYGGSAMLANGIMLGLIFQLTNYKHYFYNHYDQAF